MQTLSCLNRAYPGKDTTYVLDFVNDTGESLAAFKMYHTTAELSATTDPDWVYNLRAKLDTAGHYDDFEVERVVAVELKPGAKQSELVQALEPVRDRLIKRYKAAQESLLPTQEKQEDKAIESARNELNALILFFRPPANKTKLASVTSTQVRAPPGRSRDGETGPSRKPRVRQGIWAGGFRPTRCGLTSARRMGFARNGNSINKGKASQATFRRYRSPQFLWPGRKWTGFEDGTLAQRGPGVAHLGLRHAHLWDLPKIILAKFNGHAATRPAYIVLWSK